MTQSLRAIYRNGAFVPQTAFELSEGTEVELLVEDPQIIPPPIADEETKRQFLKALVERIQQNPIPLNAPHFVRDSLYTL